MFTFREIVTTAIGLGLLAVAILTIVIVHLRNEDKLIVAEYDDDAPDQTELDDDPEYADDEDEDDYDEEDDDEEEYDDEDKIRRFWRQPSKEVVEITADDTVTRITKLDWIGIRDYERMKFRAENPHLFSDDWLDASLRELSAWKVEQEMDARKYQRIRGIGVRGIAA